MEEMALGEVGEVRPGALHGLVIDAIAAWLAIGALGLVRPRDLRFIRRVLFPVGAAVALAAATFWALERVGLPANPLGPVEDAAIAHPWRVVVALAIVAGGSWALERIGEPPSGDRTVERRLPSP